MKFGRPTVNGPENVSRRRLLAMAGGALCAAAIMPTAVQAVPIPMRRSKKMYSRLAMENVHTNEKVNLVYGRGNRYFLEPLEDLNHFMRDWRTGATVTMDPALYDLLCVLRDMVGGADSHFKLFSGYRSPETNSMLASHSRRVAKHSYHMRGMAADIAMDGVRTSTLRDAAIELRRGGVGYYPQSGFIHVDTGPVRFW